MASLTRKHRALVLMCTAAVAFASACSSSASNKHGGAIGQSSAPPGATSSASGSTSTTYPNLASVKGQTITAYIESNPWGKQIQPLIPQFEQQTGIKVQLEQLGEAQSEAKIGIELRTHSPQIDVYNTLTSLEGQMYEQNGYYEPLTPYVNDPKSTPSSYQYDDFSPAAIAAETVNNKVVAIPTQVGTTMVYYRTDILKQYGLPVPSSLDELISDAKTVYEKSNGKYVVATRGLSSVVSFTFSNLLHNMGVAWYGANGKPNFGDPRAADAIGDYVELAAKYGPKGVVNNNFTQEAALMAQGTAWLMFDASGELSAVTGSSSTVNGKLGIISLPAGPGGSHPTLLQWGLAMSPYSKHKAAAWDFIMWATSQQMALKLALGGAPSPRTSTSTESAYEAKLGSDPLMTQWQNAIDFALKNGNPEVGPPVVQQTQARKVIGDAIDKAMLGQASPKSAASQIQSGLSQLK